MQNKTYKKIEIVGTSPNGIDDATKHAIDKASASVKNIDWFEIVESRGRIEEGAVAEFQVTLKVGFRLEDNEG